LTWADLTLSNSHGFGVDLTPGNSFIITVTFTAKAPAESTTNNAEVNYAVDPYGGTARGSESAVVVIIAGENSVRPRYPVGGYVVPVNKLEVLAPYIALAGLVTTASIILRFRRKRNA
jgi:hypothetical protein